MKPGLQNKKNMPCQASVISKFVLNFLRSKKVSDDIVDAWEDKQTQTTLKRTIKRQRLVHPRGIINPYIFFCREDRPKILQEQPELPMKKVACIMGKRWAELKASTKPEDIERIKKYEMAYEEERKRYAEEKQILEPSRPKKEQVINTAYKAFCDAERKAGNKATIVELNTKWKTVRKDESLMEVYKAAAGKV